MGFSELIGTGSTYWKNFLKALPNNKVRKCLHNKLPIAEFSTSLYAPQQDSQFQRPTQFTKPHCPSTVVNWCTEWLAGASSEYFYLTRDQGIWLPLMSCAGVSCLMSARKGHSVLGGDMFRGDICCCHLSDAKVRALGTTHTSHTQHKMTSVKVGNVSWRSTKFMLGYFNTSSNNDTSLKMLNSMWLQDKNPLHRRGHSWSPYLPIGSQTFFLFLSIVCSWN